LTRRLNAPRQACQIVPQVGSATKAPKRLAAEELHPMTGDSSGVSWDDPEEL
jgi:hypothetical protein